MEFDLVIFQALSLILILLTSNAQANTRDGLVGWWGLDEESGTMTDSSRNGGGGTLTGTTASSNCPVTKCRTFNGTSDYISIADNNRYSFGNSTTDTPFSVSAWFYNTEPSGFSFHAVSKQGALTTITEWLLNVGGTGYYAFRLYGDSSTAIQEAQVSDSLASALGDVGKWAHITGTYDGRGGTSARDGIIVYRNGEVLATTGTTNGTYDAMNNTTGTVNIGAAFPGLGYHATGRIDDVRIYNRVLTAQEVKDLYNAGIEIKGTGTKLDY